MTAKNTDHFDPHPGDFDAELEAVSPGDVHVVEASSERQVSVQVVLSGTEALGDLSRELSYLESKTSFDVTLAEGSEPFKGGLLP
jgi:hypothetical protein